MLLFAASSLSPYLSGLGILGAEDKTASFMEHLNCLFRTFERSQTSPHFRTTVSNDIDQQFLFSFVFCTYMAYTCMCKWSTSMSPGMGPWEHARIYVHTSISLTHDPFILVGKSSIKVVRCLHTIIYKQLHADMQKCGFGWTGHI